MQGGKRALTPWNRFVKKVYDEGKRKNSGYSFQQALKDASKRKSEMGSSTKKTKKGSNKTRRNRRRNTRRR
jgi:hypothetical protein